MDKREMNYFKINLSAIIAYLAERSEEPDDAPSQYVAVIEKVLDTIEKMNFELMKTIAYNKILISVFKDKTQVVRCMDCKYCFTDGENVAFNVCELNHNKVQADEWYCADGEYKE